MTNTMDEILKSDHGNKDYWKALSFNPLSPDSDENGISLYIITTCSNIQVMRIKEVITKDEMSWYLDKFS